MLRFARASGALGLACATALAVAQAPPDSHYSATLRRTAYGIAHVSARDEAGIGYGAGYAYAQDNACMLAETLVTARGERSRYFGATAVGGPDVESGSIQSSNLESDFFFKLLNASELVKKAWSEQKPEVQALLRGYAAGFNRYLSDTTAARLPEACRDAPWVRPIEATDLIRFMRRLAVETGSLAFMSGLVSAQPPGVKRATIATQVDSLDREAWAARRARLGSNGVALGREATVNGRGVLLGNPHYPWRGSLRFHQQHLTIPGKLDVMGVALGGLPVIVIGFNRQLAWTHTVNTSVHFTLHALRLDSKDPTAYWVDSERHRLHKRTVHVAVRDERGRIVKRSHDFWISRYGPIVHVPGKLEWDRTMAYALRDANFDNNRMLNAWHGIDSATSLDALSAAVSDTAGIPWVNTLAADAAGEALFAGVSVVPNVPAAKLKACVSDEHAGLAADGLYVLEARKGCEWDDDPTATQPGIVPAKRLPLLRRADFVQNSNESAWLSNPAAPLTGFDPLISVEDYEQNGRTRTGINQILARLAGGDGLAGRRFDADSLGRVAFNNRSDYGGRVREDLRVVCADENTKVSLEGREVDIRGACEAFREWDGSANLESRGRPVARAWIARLEKLGPKVWAEPFNVQRPLDTPQGIRVTDPVVKRLAREELARLVLDLDAKAIDGKWRWDDAKAPWGDLHVARCGQRSIPMHGGTDAYNAMVSREEGGKATVYFGASYVQLVGFDGRGPQAQAVLTYSQSTDPRSPHFCDQAAAFSSKQWIAQPFTEEAIRAEQIGRTQDLRE